MRTYLLLGFMRTWSRYSLFDVAKAGFLIFRPSILFNSLRYIPIASKQLELTYFNSSCIYNWMLFYQIKEFVLEVYVVHDGSLLLAGKYYMHNLPGRWKIFWLISDLFLFDGKNMCFASSGLENQWSAWFCFELAGKKVVRLSSVWKEWRKNVFFSSGPPEKCMFSQRAGRKKPIFTSTRG